MQDLEEKKVIFKTIELSLREQGFDIRSYDIMRPWGGYFVINENQAQKFSDQYFNGLDVEELKISGKLSPKILVVSPNRKLSWQYHHRREEVWRVIEGAVGVITSPTDEEGDLKILMRGDQIKLAQQERHRLVGLEDWAVLAEVWQHTDSEQPSDEEDIVRVQDDFGR